MTPRERILGTLNRTPIDRTPVDIWHTPEVLDALRAHTGSQDALEVYRRLGLDKIVWAAPAYEPRPKQPNEDRARSMWDAWGVRTRTVKSGAATYEEVTDPPFADYTDPAQLEDYAYWPDLDKFDYAAGKKNAERAREFGFATIGPWISHFEIYCGMRGLENAMMDVIAEPEFLDASLDKIGRIQAAMLDRFLAEMGDLVDIVFISDDMGSQESLLISLGAWDRFLHERVANWCKIVHRHGKKAMFHSDGAVRELIPRLIHCGVDILNPIQHICPGMEMKSLKRDFGDSLVFYGGVENQSILPFGSRADVENEVLHCLNELGEGGGYICASCHNIQAGTPVENILALIETVHKHGASVLKS